MLHKPLLLLGTLLVSGAVVGQSTLAPAPTIGSATKVQGLVTVSDGKSIASVVDGSRFVEGSRIVTSSSGSVTVKTDKGCDIRLDPNQSITLHGRRSCEALIASIQSLPGELVAPAGAGKTLLVAAAAVVTGGFLLRDSTNSSGGSIPNVPISNE
jgi:hypothetical protein